MLKSRRQHRYHSLSHRALVSFFIIFVVLSAGTLGYHWIEKVTYIDAFYFMSMIATAQGPASVPSTVAGKIFVSVMAFVSVGSVVTALGFLLGPFFGKLVKVGIEKFEQEMNYFKKP